MSCIFTSEGWNPRSWAWAASGTCACQGGDDHLRFMCCLFFFFLTLGPVSWQAEKETCLAMQYSDSVLHLTPKKNTCVFRSHPAPVICSPSVRTILAQWQEQGMPSDPFQQQATKVCRLPPALIFSVSAVPCCVLVVWNRRWAILVFYLFLQWIPNIYTEWSIGLHFYSGLWNIGIPLHGMLCLYFLHCL